ncbi:MAG: c-type cytochrome [Planctomycetaceae bacterium]|nr:c-type cytochrome [Planctomycetaceae bacterium]
MILNGKTAVLLSCALACGCARPAQTPSSTTQPESPATVAVGATETAQTEPAAEAAGAAATEPAAPDATAATPEPTTPAAPAESPAPAIEPAAAEPVAASLSTEVTLGDPALTAGIPGDGPLTVEQVQAWLATPGIHDPLTVALPLGLSLGERQIVGLDENPMTRAKIELGRQIYFDGRISGDGTISCASCHHPDTGYAAATQFGVGVRGQTGNRNSPVSYNRILSGPQFWDGRAPSLEEQAKGPIANPIEMSSTHEACIECIKGHPAYVAQFEAIFGPDSVNIDNVAMAIASFERTIVTGPSAYDYRAALQPFLDQFATEEDLADLKADDPDLYARYEQLKAEAEANPMSESAIRGQALFFNQEVNCTACHVGANFSDEKFHNLGVGMEAAEPDTGRAAVTGDDKDTGAFKTPTIRNVEFTAPYMHDGSQKTLEEVVEWYAKGGHPNPHLDEKIKKLNLSDQDKADLVAFMKACNGAFPIVEHARLPE